MSEFKAMTTDRQHDNPISSKPFRVNPIIRRKTDRSLECGQQERARISSCRKPRGGGIDGDKDGASAG